VDSAFVAVEATYGFLTDLLALQADTGHILSDTLGLLLAGTGHLCTGYL
jgi:cobalt-zinc-cadmium efflux system protein